MTRTTPGRRPMALLAVTCLVAALSGAGLARADTSTSPEIASALSYLNGFRAEYGAPAAIDDPGMDAAAQAHASYMQENTSLSHSEDSSAPGYSAAGNTAAGCGDEAAGVTSLSGAIDEWMQAPFHALVALGTFGNQTLGMGRDTGFASLTCATSLANGPPPTSQPPTFPATFPGDKASLPYYRFGGESPDPRAQCGSQGLDPSSVNGFGLIASFGPAHGTVTIATATLTPAGGQPLPVCVVDEANYTGDGSAFSSNGASILSQAHAVVTFPRDPLVPGTTYVWTTTADSETVTRTFTTANAQLSMTVEPYSAYPRDLFVQVSSPSGSGAGNVTVNVQASNGDPSTGPVVATGTVQPGTSTFYANIDLPGSLTGVVHYVVTTGPKPGYLAAAVSGTVNLNPVMSTTGGTNPAGAANTATGTVKPAATPGLAASAGFPRAGCTLTAPKTIRRIKASVHLTVTQRCHGLSGLTIKVQRHVGRRWATVASVKDRFGSGSTTWRLTRSAARKQQFRWILISGTRIIATSNITTAS